MSRETDNESTQSREEIEAVVFGFFEKLGGVPGRTRDEQLSCAFLESGLLQSIDIVELVVELESRFGIFLSPEELQSEEFRTVGGLLSKVERLRNACRVK